MAGRTREFGIPGDLARMQALGYVRKGRWTRREIERRLASIEGFLDQNLAPDARGLERGMGDKHTWWEGIKVPGDLAAHASDLRDAIAAVRRMLAGDDMEALSERIDGIEALVRDMCDRAMRPHTERGLGMPKSGRKGGDAKALNLRPKVLDAMAEMQRLIDKGKTVSRAAKLAGVSRSTWYRRKK